ncbi:MAG: hypothetical protein EBT45_08565, partial [Alphaproteobacteria bacterium]|nr:hypothetical protein [Alphaproteobacteria bacterium]
PVLDMQKIGLVSFVPAKGAKPNDRGIYGFAKLRGNFANEAEANERAEFLIKTHDSYHQIYHTYVGRPFPITSSSDYSKEINRVELNKQMTEAIGQDVKEKREKEQREIEEIKKLIQPTGKSAGEQIKTDIIGLMNLIKISPDEFAKKYGSSLDGKTKQIIKTLEDAEEAEKAKKKNGTQDETSTQSKATPQQMTGEFENKKGEILAGAKKDFIKIAVDEMLKRIQPILTADEEMRKPLGLGPSKTVIEIKKGIENLKKAIGTK